MIRKFYRTHLAEHNHALAVITEEYWIKIRDSFPDAYGTLRYAPFESEETFTELNGKLPFDIATGRKIDPDVLTADEKIFFELHQLLISHYSTNGLAPEPWWNLICDYNHSTLSLAELLVEFQISSGLRLFSPVVEFVLVRYRPQFEPLLNEYFENSPPINNSSAERLRLYNYDGVDGDLFLILNSSLKIVAMTSVIRRIEQEEPVAKIYGRLHFSKGVPKSLIDRLFEPALFEWCERRGIQKVYLTVNANRHRTLDWTVRRIGERRHLFRVNKYRPDIGAKFRSSLVPFEKMILEYGVWQYALYSSPDGKFFLNRETQNIDPRAKSILKREYGNYTQNWD